MATEGQDYQEITGKLQEEAKKYLEDKDIKYIIGWTAGSYGLRVSPAFIDDVNDVNSLIWSPFCINSLAVYPTLEEKLPLPRGVAEDVRRIVVMVKGCDSRGLVQMFVEKGYPRERIVILGVPCTGQIEPKKLIPIFVKNGVDKDVKLAEIEVTDSKDNFMFKIGDINFEVPKIEVIYDKCLTCRYPNPIVYDDLIADEVVPRGTLEEGYIRVTEIDSMTTEERWAYWSEKFDRCIRCYCCQETCPEGAISVETPLLGKLYSRI